MASTNFYYSPTAGTGNAQITVSAATINQTTADTRAVITFTNGVSSCTVTVYQKFRPRFNQGPTSVPATGGSVTGYVKSDYDIVFYNVPTWVTISLHGNQIAPGQRVPASALTEIETNIVFTAAANTGASRDSGYEGMKFSYYMGDTIQTGDSTTVSVKQAANDGIAADTAELVIDWNKTDGNYFNIATYENWTSEINDE